MATLVYPAVFTLYEGSYSVYVPDMDINTQGKDLADAIAMTRDAIGIMGITMQDDGEEFPEPSNAHEVKADATDVIAFIDIDFDEYRRKYDSRTERRNVTIPRWLNALAKDNHINVSEVLTEALKEKLDVS